MVFRTRMVLPILVLAGLLSASAAAAPRSATQPTHRPGKSAPHAAGSQPDKVAAAHAHYAAGVVQALSGDPELALEEFRQAAQLDPTDEELTMDVSRRFVERRHLEQALELLKRSAARPEAGGQVFSRLGFIYAQLGRLDEAIAANRQAIKRSPADFAGHQFLYDNLLQRGQRAEACQVLEQAAQVSAADAGFLVNLAGMFVNHYRQFPAEKTSANQAALAALNRAAELKPSDVSLRLRLADGFSSTGDAVQAARIYESLLPETGDDTLVRANIRGRLVDLYLRRSDPARAITQLEAITREDPANVAASYQLGGLAEEEQNHALAAESLRRVVVLRPDFEQAYYELAQAQVGLNQPAATLATLAEARQKFRPNFVGEFLSGIASGELKKFDDALAHLNAAEAIARASEPQRLNGGFYYQLGSVYERKGDFAQAEKYLRHSLELAPDLAMAQNYLGYMWADRGTNLDEARQLIEQAVKAEPKSFAYLDSLGWVLFKLHQPEAALPQILKAIELSPAPDATLYEHLGDVYLALHQPGKARAAWKKSLQVESNAAVRRKLDSTPAR